MPPLPAPSDPWSIATMIGAAIGAAVAGWHKVRGRRTTVVDQPADRSAEGLGAAAAGATKTAFDGFTALAEQVSALAEQVAQLSTDLAAALAAGAAKDAQIRRLTAKVAELTEQVDQLEREIEQLREQLAPRPAAGRRRR